MQRKEEMKKVLEQLSQGIRLVRTVEVEELLSMEKTAIVDVRSPKEYAEDHIYGAINLPILDDDERALIGTIYKREGKEQAVEQGIDCTQGKMADFLERFRRLKEEYDQVVIYCFRGGMRSQSIAEYIYLQGIEVMKLNGGYKAYRRYLLDFFENRLEQFTFVVLHGHTGAGKTELLQELSKQGYDALDLEFYAKHSGSVFGDLFFEQSQPPQKIFEREVFRHLYYSHSKYILMESESPKIGRVFVPQPFAKKMEKDRHILIRCSMKERVKRSVRDYTAVLNQEDEGLKKAVHYLRQTIGNEAVGRLKEAIDRKEYVLVAEYLMEHYYDKLYEYSIDKYRYDKVVSADDIAAATAEIAAYIDADLSEGV